MMFRVEMSNLLHILYNNVSNWQQLPTYQPNILDLNHSNQQQGEVTDSWYI